MQRRNLNAKIQVVTRALYPPHPHMNDDNSISARCTVHSVRTHIVYGVLVRIDDLKSKLFRVHSN